jgi:putative transcriptional regulator
VKVNLRDLRRDRGLTLAVASEQMGISTAALSLIELGRVNPTPPVAFRVASFYGLRVSDIWPTASGAEAAA